VAASGLQRLLAHVLAPTSHAFWHSHTFMLQLEGDVAVVDAGRVVAAQSMGPAQLQHHDLPGRLAVNPLCVEAGHAAALTLTGDSVAAPGTAPVVKSGGSFVALDSVSSSSEGEGESGSVLHCSLTAPVAGSGSNVLWIEACRGSYLSQARPVLIVDDPQLAQVCVGVGACVASRLWAVR
jgi:hypothetical protein